MHRGGDVGKQERDAALLESRERGAPLFFVANNQSFSSPSASWSFLSWAFSSSICAFKALTSRALADVLVFFFTLVFAFLSGDVDDGFVLASFVAPFIFSANSEP